MDSKLTSPFDSLADRYDSWFDHHQAVFQSELSALMKVIPNTGQGVEVGVGSGRFAEALGINMGVEPSEKLREMAKKRNIAVLEGTAESLPFPKESFDYLLFCTVLCFLDKPLRGLAEAKRVLKPDGSLIIGMINRDSLLGKYYESRKHDNPFYQSANFYSVEEVIALIDQTGFVSKEIYQTIFSPLNSIRMPEPVKPGYDEGGFVVIRAIDRLYDINTDVSS